MADRNSMDAVMERMGSYLDALDAIPRAAHATYRSYKPTSIFAIHSARTQANCIYDHMVDEAVTKLAGFKNIRQVESKGLKLWLFDDHTAARWKKMDEDGKSKNYPTKQAKDFDYGRQLDGLPPAPTRISVGYFLDPTQTAIARVQIARMKGKYIDWCAAIIPYENRAAGGRKWEAVTKQIGFGG